MTALPHPAKVSQNVPIASAAYFLVFIRASHMFALLDPKEAPVKSALFEETGAYWPNLSNFHGFPGPKTAFSGGHRRFCLLHARAQG
jgi:hypothetical protein